MTPAEVERRRRARKGEGDRLRAQILDATADLLVSSGSAEDVSIRSVAEAVGVTPPSIYRHFADKTELIFEVCLVSFKGLADDIADAVVEGDPLATIKAQARAYIRYGVGHPEHYRLMFMTLQENTPEDLGDELFAPESAFAMFLETVEQVLDAGLVRPELVEVGPTKVGLHLWAMVHGLTSLRITKPGLPWGDLDEVMDEQLDVILRGLTAEDD